MIFFIKNTNLTKKISGGWEGSGWGVARVSDFFFSKESKFEKKLFSFRGGEGKGGLASVSEFVLQRIHILKKLFFFSLFILSNFIFFLCVCVCGGGGGEGAG